MDKEAIEKIANEMFDIYCMKEESKERANNILIRSGWTPPSISDQLRTENSALRAERDKLRDALAPFARYECGCGECHNCIANTALGGDKG